MVCGIGISDDLHSITQIRFDARGCKDDDTAPTGDHSKVASTRRNIMPKGFTNLSRRAAVAGAGATTLGASALAQQHQNAALGTPPSVISNPPRQWGRLAPPDIYPDPDIIVVDPAFNNLLLGLTPIRRVWTGFRW